MAGVGGGACTFELQLAVLLALANLCNQQGAAVAKLWHKLPELVPAIYAGSALIAWKWRVARKNINTLCAAQFFSIQAHFGGQGGVEVNQASLCTEGRGRHLGKIRCTQTCVFLNQNRIVIMKQRAVLKYSFVKQPHHCSRVRPKNKRNSWRRERKCKV